MTLYESPNPTSSRLVPVNIYPGANLEDAGFSDEQRTDLFGWFLQVGSGAAGAAVGVKDVHYDVVRGFAWIRLEVLGPAGHGHVDVDMCPSSDGAGAEPRAGAQASQVDRSPDFEKVCDIDVQCLGKTEEYFGPWSGAAELPTRDPLAP